MKELDDRGGTYRSSLTLLPALRLVLLLLPDHGFTRGRTVRPRQVQYFACKYFPDCPIKPVRDYKGNRHRTTFPICREHGVPMDQLVIWKPRG